MADDNPTPVQTPVTEQPKPEVVEEPTPVATPTPEPQPEPVETPQEPIVNSRPEPIETVEVDVDSVDELPKDSNIKVTGEPEIEVAVTDEKEEAKPEKPYTIRSEETGDKVYVVKNEKRHWLKNPQSLTKLGFSLGQEKNVPFAELLKFPEGEPIDMTIPGAVLPWDKPEGEEPVKTEPDQPHRVWS